MPKANNKENLHELEKIVKKIIRKSLKDNTLDYTVQYTISSLEPGKIKYAAQISSPAKGVEPVTYIYDNYKDLENSLVESVEGLDKRKVEMAFHQSRINTYMNKANAHKERLTQMEEGKDLPKDEDEDVAIPMEEV